MLKESKLLKYTTFVKDVIGHDITKIESRHEQGVRVFTDLAES
jgi:hypothetical protein